MCKMLTGLDILLTLRPSLITVPFAVVSFCARAKANSAELKSNRFIGMREFFPEGSIGGIQVAGTETERSCKKLWHLSPKKTSNNGAMLHACLDVDGRISIQ